MVSMSNCQPDDYWLVFNSAIFDFAKPQLKGVNLKAIPLCCIMHPNYKRFVVSLVHTLSAYMSRV